ncbi:hypothetical protein HHX47_DHR2000976 [Lentinula edodes]|nr:hypothetical protein HHX47_DHR2000976 [Lentinula edodes]
MEDESPGLAFVSGFSRITPLWSKILAILSLGMTVDSDDAQAPQGPTQTNSLPPNPQNPQPSQMTPQMPPPPQVSPGVQSRLHRSHRTRPRSCIRHRMHLMVQFKHLHRWPLLPQAPPPQAPPPQAPPPQTPPPQTPPPQTPPPQTPPPQQLLYHKLLHRKLPHPEITKWSTLMLLQGLYTGFRNQMPQVCLLTFVKDKLQMYLLATTVTKPSRNQKKDESMKILSPGSSRQPGSAQPRAQSGSQSHDQSPVDIVGYFMIRGLGLTVFRSCKIYSITKKMMTDIYSRLQQSNDDILRKQDQKIDTVAKSLVLNTEILRRIGETLDMMSANRKERVGIPTENEQDSA